MEVGLFTGYDSANSPLLALTLPHLLLLHLLPQTQPEAEVPATVLELHAVTAAMAVIPREDGLVLASKRLIDDVYVKLADLGFISTLMLADWLIEDSNMYMI